MKKVYKYPIHPNSHSTGGFAIYITAPKGINPLFVALQNGNPFLWAEVEVLAEPEEQHVLTCYGTGFAYLDDRDTYFSSLIDGDYVWHFYIPGV